MFPNKLASVMFATSNIDPSDNYANAHLSYLNNTLDDFHILNASRSDVMGYPTPKIIFTYENGTELYKGMQFWKLKNDTARLFTYYAPSVGIFEEFLPTIDKMLKTIKVF